MGPCYRASLTPVGYFLWPLCCKCVSLVCIAVQLRGPYYRPIGKPLDRFLFQILSSWHGLVSSKTACLGASLAYVLDVLGFWAPIFP